MANLLAIDLSVRELGWALFSTENNSKLGALSEGRYPKRLQGQEGCAWSIVNTGAMDPKCGSKHTKLPERLENIKKELERMAELWRPTEAACGRQSLLHLPQRKESVEALGKVLDEWSKEHEIRLFIYPLKDVRIAMLGRANAGKEELAYTVMTRWGMIGTGKSTHEWNAIAIGDYHQSLGAPDVGASTGSLNSPQ